MRSQAKSSGIKLPEVHDVGKNLDTNLKREKHAIPQKGNMERPHISQGRAGSRRKRPHPINQSISQPSNLSQKIPGWTEIETGKTNHIHTKDLTHYYYYYYYYYYYWWFLSLIFRFLLFTMFCRV